MIQSRQLLDLAIPFLALGMVILANFHPAQAQDPSRPGVMQPSKISR